MPAQPLEPEAGASTLPVGRHELDVDLQPAEQIAHPGTLGRLHHLDTVEDHQQAARLR
jgi:hypothetical protein